MKILSWNVNSVRVRKNQLLYVIKKENPDIICLQETKTNDDSFPKDVLEKNGYFVYINGIQSYNGVAIISKIEANKINSHKFCNLDDARHIQANFNNFSIHELLILENFHDSKKIIKIADKNSKKNNLNSHNLLLLAGFYYRAKRIETSKKIIFSKLSNQFDKQHLIKNFSTLDIKATNLKFYF